MEQLVKSNKKVNFTDTNQFINTSKSTSSEERDNTSTVEDSVLSICPQCNFSTVSIQSLDTHMENEHGDNVPEFLSDSKLFNSFAITMKEENLIKNGPCFANIILDNQTKSDSSSVNSSSINVGKHISDSRRRYRCNICPVTFPWHGDLAAHLSEVHGFQKASRDGGKTRAGSYKCSFCMYVAKYQSELKRHRRLHMGVKPFGCVFCKYRSAWKGDLKRHIESHHRGHFNSEEELAAIMAQYKNNAGTDLKGTIENENQNEIKEEFNEDMTSVSERSKCSKTIDSFICDKCHFETTKKQKFTEHIIQCPLNDFPLFEDQTIQFQKQKFDLGLNLTIQSHKSSNFQLDINSCTNIPREIPINFSTLTSINDSILQIPSDIKTTTDNLNLQSLPSCIEGMDNNLLSAMVSQSNKSLHDMVSHMFKNINGIPSSQILSNSISNHSLLDCSNTIPNIFSKNTVILPTDNITSNQNVGIIHSQLFSPFQSDIKDFSKSPSENEFQSPQTTKTFEVEKGFKSINDIISSPKSQSADQKLKDISSTFLITQQEHWKRFKCSACGHRSNWKWDINKHIKVAHPERDGIATIELSYEEAKTTLQNYLNSTKANKARSHNSFESEEGYYRPYKCSACGHRSNWKWDVNKHIKQVHQRQADVITLSMEEAKSTISQYKRRRRAPCLVNFSENASVTVASTPTGSLIADKSNISSPLENNLSNDNISEKEKNEIAWLAISPTTTNSQQQNPRIDTLRLKRLKCDCCGYRSNYRSDISRHIRRKHDNMASVVFLADVVPNETKTNSEVLKLDKNDKLCNENILKKMTMLENSDNLSIQQKKQWQCNLCQFSHKEKIQVSHHITRNHNPERPFNCKLCNYGTDYRNSLLRHVKAKHKISSVHEVMNQNMSKVRYMPINEKSSVTKIKENNKLTNTDVMACSKCSEVYFNYQDLFQHTVSNHSTSDEEMYLLFKPPSENTNNDLKLNLLCLQCPFSTNNIDALQIHQFQHSEICHYLFKCPHCNYKASHNKFLLNHINLHLNIENCSSNDQPEDLSCPKIQNVRSNSIVVPEKVLKIYSMKKKYSQKIQCNKCSYRCSNICHLRVHLQKIHHKKIIKRKINDNQTLFNISNLLLIDDIMLAYKNVGYKTNPFWCDECGFLTNQESELRKHLLKHMNNNYVGEHKCSLCTYNPDSKSDLKNHQLLHVMYEISDFKGKLDGIYNNLKCDKCNFTTNLIDKLDFHEHFHYMSPTFQGFSCPKCSFKHYQLYGFIRHLKYHH